MSIQLSLEVDTARTSFVDVLRILLSSGWVVRDVEGVSFLPFEAADVSEWKLFSDEGPKVALDACEKRELAGLVPGLVLLRHDELRGGQFLWSGGRTLIVSLTVNTPGDWNFDRQLLEIGRPLEAGGVEIERLVIERS